MAPHTSFIIFPKVSHNTHPGKTHIARSRLLVACWVVLTYQPVPFSFDNDTH